MMATISKSFTFSAGATIVASEHNTNFDNIYNEFNGSIDNANIKANAAIVDTKLATISTAGKVSGAALTSLGDIPSGAGEIPGANMGSISSTGPNVFTATENNTTVLVTQDMALTESSYAVHVNSSVTQINSNVILVSDYNSGSSEPMVYLAGSGTNAVLVVDGSAAGTEPALKVVGNTNSIGSMQLNNLNNGPTLTLVSVSASNPSAGDVWYHDGTLWFHNGTNSMSISNAAIS